MFPDLSDAKLIAIDLETFDPAISAGTGTGAMKGGYIAGIAIATDTGFREYYPIGHATGVNYDKTTVLRWLAEQLGRENQSKVGANIIYDLEYLAVAGVSVAGRLYDIQLAEPLLDENQWSYSLENIAQKYLGEGKVENELKTYIMSHFSGVKEKNWKEFIYKVPGDIVRNYALGDVDLPLRILEKQLEELRKQDLLDIFYIESDLVPLMLAMKLRGVRVDLAKAEEVSDTLTQRIDKNQGILGWDVNVNASASLAAVWDRHGLSYPRTAKTNAPSFTKETLAACAHPVARLVEQVRRDMKLRDTFVHNAILKQHLNGRIHSQFNQLKSDDKGTVSGRFSSSNPNLQQVPSRGEGTELIRQIFIPEPGELWYSIDYSQIEYRCFAHYAGDLTIIDAYAKDAKTDFHAQVSDMLGGTLDRKIVKCIAEGELVLTDDEGLVPIQDLKSCSRIWDGVQWVHHDGVVFTGYKEVITHDGLTATPDHRVFTADGRLRTLGEVARDKSSPRLARTEVQGKARSFTKIRASTRLREKMSNTLRKVRGRKMAPHGQYPSSEFDLLSMQSEADKVGRREALRRTIWRRKEKMRASYKSRIQELRSAWDQGELYVQTALYNLLCPDVWASLECEGIGTGPNKQRWSLRTWESSLRNKQGKSSKSKKHKALSVAAFQTQLCSGRMGSTSGYNSRTGNMERDPVDSRDTGKLDYSTDSGLPGNRKVCRTYGVQNAGPNFRFTVSGVLTKNTFNFGILYGSGYAKIGSMLRTNMSEAQIMELYASLGDLKDPAKFQRSVAYKQRTDSAYKPDMFDITAYRVLEVYGEKFPAAKKLMTSVGDVAKSRGYIYTLLKRRRRFSKDDSTHKALNALLQGSAADIMKKAMVEVWKSGVCDTLGAPLLTVHDELNFSVPQTKEGTEAILEVRRLMETAVPMVVPTICDFERGPDWGHVE